MSAPDQTTAPRAGAVPAVRRAQPGDLEPLAALFDAYRGFYEQPSDLALARRFITERMTRGESIVFVAMPADGQPLAGFCQLYPTFCSVEAAPIRVLYDLFVSPSARGQGLAGALMQAAEDDSRRAGCARLDLSTAHTNLTAQALYESRGWKRDDVFRVYNLAL